MKLTFVADPLFEDIYNEKLLKDLKKRFGSFHHGHANLQVSSEIMGRMIDKMSQKKPRRGEVVMVIPNEQGHLWLHTKAFYPTGVYRLMTGGLELGEKPHRALLREVAEETGFKTTINRCLAVITYILTYQELALPFVSYVFMTRPAQGSPQPNDPTEAITHFQAIPVEALPGVVRKLRSLPDEFADWGIFRAIAHEVTLSVLGDEPAS